MFNNKNIEKRLEFIEFEIRNKMSEIRATNDNLFDLCGRIYKEISKDKKDDLKVGMITVECQENDLIETQWKYKNLSDMYILNIHVIGKGTYTNCKIHGMQGMSGDRCIDMQYDDFIEVYNKQV